MLNRILRSAIMAGSVWLAGIHLASAGIIPNPAQPTPTPTPDIWKIIDVSPTPNPTVPPISPAPSANPLSKADPQIARATVYYGQNGVLGLLNDRGRFQKVALQANQVVTLVVTLSPIDYGKTASVQLLDGGAMTTAVTIPKPKDILPATPTPWPSPTINSANSDAAVVAAPQPAETPLANTLPDPSTLLDTGAVITVSQAGEIAFGFKPGADAGLHRISITVGGNQYYLQFWRQDPSAPNNNPRMRHAY